MKTKCINCGHERPTADLNEELATRIKNIEENIKIFRGEFISFLENLKTIEQSYFERESERRRSIMEQVSKTITDELEINKLTKNQISSMIDEAFKSVFIK